jgi:hypothetical protein
MTSLILLSQWQSSQVEFWRKTIFEGYDVSSQGRIRSWWVIVANKGWSNGARGELSDSPRIIQGAAGDSSGYPYLNVRGTNRACPKIHRLVAIAFIPNPENKPEVNHKTGVKANNWTDNLEWATRQENIDHAWRIGLRDDIMPSGESHYGSKISDERVLEMQRLYDQGVKPIHLAPMFGVTLANTYDLAKGARGRGKTLREKSHERIANLHNR